MNLFRAEESSDKIQVNIAQEGSHQCSNTENSDSDSLTKTSKSQILQCAKRQFY